MNNAISKLKMKSALVVSILLARRPGAVEAILRFEEEEEGRWMDMNSANAAAEASFHASVPGETSLAAWECYDALTAPRRAARITTLHAKIEAERSALLADLASIDEALAAEASWQATLAA